MYIGRPSKWGNPFRIGDHGRNRKEVLAQHRKWIDGLIPGPNGEVPPTKAEIRKELRGKTLGCYCQPRDCHGDYLAAIANQTRGLFS